MYKIGAFSNITQITIKALRYYHDEGILIPSEIHPVTSYRLYSLEQISLARNIKLFRLCDFSIKEIKDIIKDDISLEDLPYYLSEKINSIEANAKRVKLINKKIIDETKEKRRGEIMNEYKVVKTVLLSEKVLSTKYTGRYDEVGHYFGELYRVAKNSVNGSPFNIYHEDGYKENTLIEVCVPVKKEIVTKNDIVFKVLPEVSGISVLHVGTYDSIGNAYQALIDYADKNKLVLGPPSRCIYIKGPGMLFKGNENKYITEVFQPII